MKTISDFGRRWRELAQEVIHRAKHTSVKAIAGALDIAPSSLYSALNPQGGDKACVPAVDWIPVIVKETGDLTLLEFIADACDCDVVSRAKRADDDEATRLAEQFVRAAKEVGDVANAIQLARADGKITPAESRKIGKEVSEAQAALSMISRLKPEIKKGSRPTRPPNAPAGCPLPHHPAGVSLKRRVK